MTMAPGRSATSRTNPFTPAGELIAHLPVRPEALDDRRDGSRWPARCDVWLLDLEGMTVLRCQTDNVSSGGLHCTVPIGYGLAVGQRYELRIRRSPDESPSARSSWTGCYGTIIRTRLITEGGIDRLGVAIRFDTAQTFDSPLAAAVGNA
jgi:hypothetical protein